MKEQKDKLPDLSESDTDKTSNTRRRFIKGSTSVPIIMAVQSRSVWGAGCSVSGTLSGNLSNPNQNNCDAPVTGRSPGYWEPWIVIYNIIKNSNSYYSLSDYKKQKFTKTGAGNSINVLYNWSLAANNNTDTRINLHPTDNSGNIISSGAAISDTSNQVLRHLVASALSAAHPDSQFPYPTSRWSVEYMIDRYMSTDVSISAELDHLLRAFFTDYHIDAPMRILGLGGSDAYNWAKNYLNL